MMIKIVFTIENINQIISQAIFIEALIKILSVIWAPFQIFLAFFWYFFTKPNSFSDLESSVWRDVYK